MDNTFDLSNLRSVVEDAFTVSSPTTDYSQPTVAEMISPVKQTTFDEELNRFMSALGQKESGNNYSSPPHMDEGYWNLGGRFQILENNWSNWAQAAGLPANAEYSAANQEQVVKTKLKQYYNDYGGNWGAVAAAWNGGGGGAANWLKKGNDSYVSGYVNDVLGMFNDGSGVNAATGSGNSSVSGDNKSWYEKLTDKLSDFGEKAGKIIVALFLFGMGLFLLAKSDTMKIVKEGGE